MPNDLTSETRQESEASTADGAAPARFDVTLLNGHVFRGVALHGLGGVVTNAVAETRRRYIVRAMRRGAWPVLGLVEDGERVDVPADHVATVEIAGSAGAEAAARFLERHSRRVALAPWSTAAIADAFEPDWHPGDDGVIDLVREWCAVAMLPLDIWVGVEKWERDSAGWVVTVLVETDDGTGRWARVELHTAPDGWPDAPENEQARASEIRQAIGVVAREGR